MLNFESDYIEGADGRILARLCQTNREPLSGYGEDRYTLSAKSKIRAACNAPDADVFFLVGGTQTNRTVISAMLPLCRSDQRSDFRKQHRAVTNASHL